MRQAKKNENSNIQTLKQEKSDGFVQNLNKISSNDPVVSFRQNGLLALFRDFVLVGGDLV